MHEGLLAQSEPHLRSDSRLGLGALLGCPVTTFPWNVVASGVGRHRRETPLQCCGYRVSFI